MWGKDVVDFTWPAYSKQRKSQGPDQKGLLAYHEILSVVITHAPHGLPSYKQLANVIERLNQDSTFVYRSTIFVSGVARRDWWMGVKEWHPDLGGQTVECL